MLNSIVDLYKNKKAKSMSNPEQFNENNEAQPSYLKGYEKCIDEKFLGKEDFDGIKPYVNQLIRLVLAPSKSGAIVENTIDLVPSVDNDGNFAYVLAFNEVITDSIIQYGYQINSIGRDQFIGSSSAEYVSSNHLDIVFASDKLLVRNHGKNGTRVELYNKPEQE